MPSETNPDAPLKPLDRAVEAALTENHQTFLRFLKRRLGSGHEAEDVLQEFYLKVLNTVHGLRKRESIVAWLFRILRSTLADHYRARERRARRESSYAREQAVQTESFDADLHALVCQCFYKLLPTLRAEYAEALWRIDLAGEARSAAARAMGISLNNLAVRLHRARLALKRALLLSCETCPEHGFDDCACDLPIRQITGAGRFSTRTIKTAKPVNE